MKKIVLALALATLPVISQPALATNQVEKTQSEKQYQEVSEIGVYEVTEIKNKKAILKYSGEIDLFATGKNIDKKATEKNIDKRYQVDLEKIKGDDLKVADKLANLGDSLEKIDTNNKTVSKINDEIKYNIDGEIYKYSGYKGRAKSSNDNNLNLAEGVDEYKGIYQRYSLAEDGKVLLIEDPIGESFIYVTEDYPKDKTLELVYNKTYYIKDINEEKNEFFLEIDKNDPQNKDEYNPIPLKGTYKDYKKGDFKKGDKVRVWMNPPHEGDGTYGLILDIYKIEKIEEEKKATNQAETKENLAKSTFNSLVQVNAARILLDQSPKTVKKIEGSLKETVNKSESLIDRAFKTLLGKNELTDADKDEAIIEMMRLNYGKKIETDIQKQLALSIYKNQITTNAGKTLLEKTPNTVKAIEGSLRANVDKSENLLKKSMDALK